VGADVSSCFNGWSAADGTQGPLFSSDQAGTSSWFRWGVILQANYYAGQRLPPPVDAETREVQNAIDKLEGYRDFATG